MVFLLLAVIYGFSLASSQVEDCVRGNHSLARFGPSCEYLCHCGTFQCNRKTGACPNNGDCDGGWMGSGCQYFNIAYNTTVYSNHLSNTATIVDGRRDTCSSETQGIIYPAYVMVSFEREVKITEVYIVFSNSVYVPLPFTVSVSDGNQSVLCNSVDYTNGQKEYVINCNSTMYVQYLNISYQWSAGIKVCEIQVPAGRNLAYGKPAIQSSLVEVYFASNAVDGLTYNKSPWLTCTHTENSTDPWWLLDLQASVMIQWFQIFNRWDSNDDKSCE
ncbi:hypothetical protein CHS0354_027329 [Potamilus streckersoni]|uniref:Fucolectin tachylectin-4 pentraxin-1 domain-containing protein n=1 Tax=Potamilus streckersoni TaxID=2493646 RepID=A0AAE0SM21_9BIVA|nr:hypothetical protein CHS0354_027329 [Potamilus streckersoni]